MAGNASAQHNASIQDAGPLPFSLKAILLSLFVPVELSFYVLGLRLTLTRLLFLVLTPFLVVKLVQRASAGRFRFLLCDAAVVLAGFWMIFASANVDGLESALNHAGPEVLEFCIGYMCTRIFLLENGHALRFVDLLCRVIAVVALVGLLDPLTNHYVAHDVASWLTATVNKLYNWQDSHRVGLLRATGPIEHPILYGFICGISLLIAISNPIRWRPFVIFSCALGTIFAWSSAPLQGTLLGCALLIYDRVMVRVGVRWLLLIGVGMLALAAAFVVSESPIGFIISHFIYDPESGYYRQWTWDRTIFYVSQSPWYGLGYGPVPDEIDHSIDSLWLVLAIHSGFVGAALVMFSLFLAASLPKRRHNINLASGSNLATTLSMLIFLTMFVSFTVHLWGTTWILIALLVGLKAHLGQLGLRHNMRRDLIYVNEAFTPKAIGAR